MGSSATCCRHNQTIQERQARCEAHTHSSEDSSIGHVLECLGRLLTAHAKWHGCWAVWRLYKAKVWLDSTITHGGARKSKPRILMQIYLCIMLLTCIFHFIKRDTLTDSRRHLEYGRYRNHIIHMYHIHTHTNIMCIHTIAYIYIYGLVLRVNGPPPNGMVPK